MSSGTIMRSRSLSMSLVLIHLRVSSPSSYFRRLYCFQSEVRDLGALFTWILGFSLAVIQLITSLRTGSSSCLLWSVFLSGNAAPNSDSFVVVSLIADSLSLILLTVVLVGVVDSTMLDVSLDLGIIVMEHRQGVGVSVGGAMRFTVPSIGV